MLAAKPQPPSFDEIVTNLNAVASNQTRTIYARRNPAGKVFGAEYGDRDRLAMRIKGQTAPALKLRDTRWAEAQTLAVRAIAAADMTPDLAERWALDIHCPVGADDLAGVGYRTPFALALLAAGTGGDRGFILRTEYSLHYRSTGDRVSGVGDETRHDDLWRTGAESHRSPNRSRQMRNMVPVAIGKRSERLTPVAMACDGAYSPVAVLHGDKTSCNVPHAVDDLLHPPVRIRG